MDGLTIAAVMTGRTVTIVHTHRPHDADEGFFVSFSLSGEWKERNALRFVQDKAEKWGLDWIKVHGKQWSLDPIRLRVWLQDELDSAMFDDFMKRIEWLQDATGLQPQIDFVAKKKTSSSTVVRLNVYKEEYLVDHKTRIFLSHKGSDKPLVQQFKSTLEMLGFAPWLDVDDMPAGVNPHRSIRQGFEDSCAAVFFITPSFKDESWLAQEIDYAMQEKTAKGNRFAIITLVFRDKDGNEGTVPKMLTSYIYKKPTSELEALREIIRAMPVSVGPVSWRSGV